LKSYVIGHFFEPHRHIGYRGKNIETPWNYDFYGSTVPALQLRQAGVVQFFKLYHYRSNQ